MAVTNRPRLFDEAPLASRPAVVPAISPTTPLPPHSGPLLHAYQPIAAPAPGSGPPPLVAASSGEAIRVGFEHLQRLLTGIELSMTRPYFFPTPFAVTYFLPHALGGFAPNEVYGLPAYSPGMIQFYSGIFDREIRDETSRMVALGRREEFIRDEFLFRQSALSFGDQSLAQALRYARGRAGKDPRDVVLTATVRFLEQEALGRGFIVTQSGQIIRDPEIISGRAGRPVVVLSPDIAALDATYRAPSAGRQSPGVIPPHNSFSGQMPLPGVPSGSIQPELIDPPNDKAKTNERNARGIAQELVHERADP